MQMRTENIYIILFNRYRKSDKEVKLVCNYIIVTYVKEQSSNMSLP